MVGVRVAWIELRGTQTVLLNVPARVVVGVRDDAERGTLMIGTRTLFVPTHDPAVLLDVATVTIDLLAPLR